MCHPQVPQRQKKKRKKKKDLSDAIHVKSVYHPLKCRKVEGKKRKEKIIKKRKIRLSDAIPVAIPVKSVCHLHVPQSHRKGKRNLSVPQILKTKQNWTTET